MSRFSETLENLSAVDVRANISLIKTAVKQQVEANDTRVRVELTDHFNHSFVPDMILSWPGEGRHREVFLRTAYRQIDLQRDIDTLADKKPILLPLRQGHMPQEQSSSLRRRASGTNTLIASPEGFEALQDETTERPVVSLLSHNLLQGGRGVMTVDDAHETSSELEAGFDGAREGDTTRTSVAIEAAAELLDSEHAGRINRLLHAVWVGSGSSGSTFPASAGITATLDAESLKFVLDLPDVDDDEFWRRLGSGLTLGRLCELETLGDTDNFQRLLKDNAYRLAGKAARVIRTNSRVDSPRWSVAARALVLSVAEDRIYMVPTSLDELPTPGEQVSIPVRQFQNSCAINGIKVREIRLASGDNAVSYANEAGGDIIAANEISQLQDVMPGASLTAAVAITGTHDLTINFKSRTASGYGPARFPLSTLVGMVTPILISNDAIVVADAVGRLAQPATSQAPHEASDTSQQSATAIESAAPTALSSTDHPTPDQDVIDESDA